MTTCGPPRVRGAKRPRRTESPPFAASDCAAQAWKGANVVCERGRERGHFVGICRESVGRCRLYLGQPVQRSPNGAHPFLDLRAQHPRVSAGAKPKYRMVQGVGGHVCLVTASQHSAAETASREPWNAQRSPPSINSKYGWVVTLRDRMRQCSVLAHCNPLRIPCDLAALPQPC